MHQLYGTRTVPKDCEVCAAGFFRLIFRDFSEYRQRHDDDDDDDDDCLPTPNQTATGATTTMNARRGSAAAITAVDLKVRAQGASNVTAKGTMGAQVVPAARAEFIWLMVPSVQISSCQMTNASRGFPTVDCAHPVGPAARECVLLACASVATVAAPKAVQLVAPTVIRMGNAVCAAPNTSCKSTRGSVP